MAERTAQEEFLRASLNREQRFICVLTSMEFILPDNVRIPEEFYRKAVEEDGIYPTELVDELERKGFIRYEKRMIRKGEEQAFRYLLEQMFERGEIIGALFSMLLDPETTHMHLVGVKGPITGEAHEVKIFDTRLYRPVSRKPLMELVNELTERIPPLPQLFNVILVYRGEKLKSLNPYY